MKPKAGQLIKVFFRNGTIVEGICEAWSDAESILSSEDHKSRFVILSTKQDVMAIKITNDPTRSVTSKAKILEEFEAITERPKTPDSLDRMVDLKQELIRLEKEEVDNKVRSHVPIDIVPVTYADSIIATKSRAVEHSEPEGSRADIRNYPVLPRMFQNQNKNKR